jgi:dolichol-phosphate mannosyltransferase
MLDLALVMPVYNEQDCIVEVVRSWRDRLAGLGIRFRMIVLNDGSRDGTRDALAAFEGDPDVTVIHKPNSGHGPTILMGYRQAAELATWVFQCDSDDEMKPEHFPELWNRRDAYDVLFGMRQGRRQNAARKAISACSRLTVRVLFGKGVLDVNTPYRLMRAALLKPILPQIPDNTFAPNVIISGTLARAGVRICNLPVPHEGRRTGTVSIVKWKLWKSAARALWQTFRCRPVLEVRPIPGPPR